MTVGHTTFSLFMFMVPCIANLYYNKPTRCSCLQSISFHCRVTLHVSGAFHAHHQEYIKLYLQPPVQAILSLQLPSSNMANLATLEEGSCNNNMTCTRGCRYSLMFSWWWVWKAPETSRVTLQWNKIDCEQLHLVGLL
jgi:hypothetical protein